MRAVRYFAGDVAVYSVVLVLTVIATGFEMEMLHVVTV